MERVLIVGASGCGKSTLARELAARVDLPLIHLDREFWLPGWVEMDRAVWRDKLARLCEQPRWVMDGNYGSTLPMRLGRADTIVFLDYPRRIYLFRVLKRIFKSRGRVRPDMGDGCPEHLDWEFLRWVWNFERDERPKISNALPALSDDQVLHRFCHPRELEAWKRTL